MLVWLIISIILALLGIIELFLNFTIPFTALRTILLFLLVMGMTYRIYLMEQGGEKETLKTRVRELEDKLREIEMGGE
jgi:Tfp pilus assembly protein PilO